MSKHRDLNPYLESGAFVHRSSQNQSLVPDPDLFVKKKVSSRLTLFDFDEDIIIDKLEIFRQQIKHL